MSDNKESTIYKAINLERLDFGMKNQQQVSRAIGKGTTDGYVWSKIRSGKISFNLLSKVCNVCGLQLIIRNPRKNCEYVLNNPKTHK